MDAGLPAWLNDTPVAHAAVKAGVVIGCYAVSSLAASWLAVRIGRAQGHEPDRIRNALNAVRTLLRLLFAVVLLIVLGVDLAAIPAFLGSLLAVVGVACFASWSVLSNITSGLILFATKDLHLGDLVRIGSGDEAVEGRIAEFRLWTLLLRREDGCPVIYPNNLILQKPVTVLQRSKGEGRTTQLLLKST